MPLNKKSSGTGSNSSLSYGAVANQRLLAVQKRLVTPSSPSVGSPSSKDVFISSSTAADDGVVITEHASGIYEILLNRPTKLNSITFSMCDIIAENLLAWEMSEVSKVVLIKGAGEKAFCAGGDIRDLVDLELAGRHDECIDLFKKHCRLNHVVGTRRKTCLIAIMDGITMGGGVGLSINAPFRIATENTVHAMPECSIGHFPDASASFWYPRLDGYLGLYLGLTGHRLRGVDVFYAGIATHYVSSKNLNKLEDALKELVRNNGTLEQDAINAAIEQFYVDMDQEKAPMFSLGGDVYKAINRCFQHDTMEEIVVALKDEKIATTWAKETLDQLANLSPTSLKLFLQLYHAGASLSFTDCMKLEYQLTNQTLAGREFKEGARTTLITRTAPKWDPPTVETVNASDIKHTYFDTLMDKPLTLLCEGGDNKDYPFARFALPQCSEILNMAERSSDRESTIMQFIEKYNGKKGIKAKVISVLSI
ncbi:ClpP/crotonase-like domain-containing protein [Zychaea mexicana]|uniref:ClpP/crotonase-like domain-containing protein n=1 Tax=Zychaea mexicana TaxID=64656 RepID=UPI0022FF0CA8|nr:ClpP/crotonase-like domain-containing protein [Zychaea mexicana]KAI9499606.1 ClpP/crotonase-like domain-containing protein [Zychaea mexicana]